MPFGQFQYQSITDPVSTQPETVTESRWHQPWSEPVRFKIAPRLAVALLASGCVLVSAAPFPETVTESRWHQPLSEPVRVKIDPRLAVAQAASGLFFVGPTTGENITADKWFAYLSEPVRFKGVFQGLPTGDQLTFTTSPLPFVSFSWMEALTEPVVKAPPRLATPSQVAVFPSPLPLVSFSWMEALTEPVRVPRRLNPALQPVAFPSPLPFVSFAWYRPQTELPPRAKVGLAASLQQFLAAPPRLLPTPTITGTINAIETGDSALFAGLSFARPTTAMIGVVELAKVPYVGLIETRASQGVSGVVENARAPTSGSPTTSITSAAVGIRII